MLKRRHVVHLATGALLLGFAAMAAPALAQNLGQVDSGRLAIGGYDPVAYFTNGQPTKGSTKYSFQWKGVTYRFASAENLQRFKADLEKYLPQYGGYCAYAMSLDRIADIDPYRWAIVGGKLYLNNGFIAQDLWSLNKSGNIASADHNWPLYPKKAEDK